MTWGRPCLKGAGRGGTGRRERAGRERRPAIGGRRLRADRAPPRPRARGRRGILGPRPLRPCLRGSGSPAWEALLPRPEAASCVGLRCRACCGPVSPARCRPEGEGSSQPGRDGSAGPVQPPGPRPQGGAASSRSLEPGRGFDTALQRHAALKSLAVPGKRPWDSRWLW